MSHLEPISLIPAAKRNERVTRVLAVFIYCGSPLCHVPSACAAPLAGQIRFDRSGIKKPVILTPLGPGLLHLCHFACPSRSRKCWLWPRLSTSRSPHQSGQSLHPTHPHDSLQVLSSPSLEDERCVHVGLWAALAGAVVRRGPQQPTYWWRHRAKDGLCVRGSPDAVFDFPVGALLSDPSGPLQPNARFVLDRSQGWLRAGPVWLRPGIVTWPWDATCLSPTCRGGQ